MGTAFTFTGRNGGRRRIISRSAVRPGEVRWGFRRAPRPWG